jgi:hypothetical protein
VLNLPPAPGPTGYVLLALGAIAGVALLVLGRGPVARELGTGDRLLTFVVTAALAATVAGAPFTLWRVVVDIRETAPITPEHAQYVGAETKLIDGELVRRIEALIPDRATYYVGFSPGAYIEIRESLRLWLGYELLPRRQARSAVRADWIITWGAAPSELGLGIAAPRLVGRNRLADREPVYLAKSAS